MTKTNKKTLSLWVLALIFLVSCFCGVFALKNRTVAKAEENTVGVTQVQFRTSNGNSYFFLGMGGQTDYVTGNQSHAPSLVTNTNLLDNVTVYFLNGAYSLREIWTGESVGTYFWGDADTLVFQMKSEYVSTMGIGARIESGAEIPMLDGTKKVTSVVRTFWRTGDSADQQINDYIEGYNTIPTTIAKVHLRGRLNIGLGDGNDWVNGVGRTDVLPTQVPATDGTTTYSGTYWRKMLACNFLGKVKLHLKETDTWATLGSILNYDMANTQLSYYFNGWGETGGTMQIDINTAYNGTTVDKILFEKGCEFPSYYYLGNENAPYTVHVLDAEYLCTSNDMSQAELATDWTFEKRCEVTFNGGNGVWVTPGETVAFPTDLSETKPEDSDYRYVYNWFNGSELYDFSKPVTSHLDLTSYVSFTAIPNKKFIISFVNGEEAIEPMTVNYGEKVGQLPAVTEKAGYDGAWAIDGNVIDSNYAWSINGDATATAVYTPKQYLLSFENGEEVIDPITVTYGEKVGKLPAVSEKTNYNGAWTLNGVAIDSESVWNIADNATAVAAYSLVEHTVTFDGANATPVTHGGKVEKPADPKKESTAEYNYTFEGWYLGDKKWDFAADVVEENIDLVAKYVEEKRAYTITFNITGKDGLTLAPVTVEYGTSYDLTELFEEAQTTGYIYSVTVNGKDKASLVVTSDVTVEVVFAVMSTAEEEKGGCSGAIAASAVCVLLAAGAALALKKKED